MLILKLRRRWYGLDVTQGTLKVGNRYTLYTLEDKVRSTKIPKITAIPYGTYPVDLTWSPKFQKLMPIIQNVPGFEGIRIHKGNTPDDTEGCLLVGSKMREGIILESKKAFDKLINTIREAKDKEEPIVIKITDEREKLIVIGLLGVIGIAAIIWLLNK